MKRFIFHLLLFFILLYGAPYLLTSLPRKNMDSDLLIVFLGLITFGFIIYALVMSIKTFRPAIFDRKLRGRAGDELKKHIDFSAQEYTIDEFGISSSKANEFSKRLRFYDIALHDLPSIYYVKVLAEWIKRNLPESHMYKVQTVTMSAPYSVPAIQSTVGPDNRITSVRTEVNKYSVKRYCVVFRKDLPINHAPRLKRWW
jgi:hypothetical protein